MKKIISIVALIFSIHSGSFSQAWLPSGTGTSGTIYGMANDSVHNRLFVSGNFTTMDGILVNHLAIWNGNAWSIFFHNNGFTGMTNTVDKLLVWNNYLYMVMNNSGAGQSIYRTPLDNFDVQFIHSFNGGVTDLVVYHDTLYACGDFTGMMSKWTGGSWVSVTGGLGSGIGLGLDDMEVYNDKIYVVGNFEITSPYITKDVAVYNNGVWEDVGNNLVADLGNLGTYVYAIKPYHNKLYIGGVFNTTDGSPGNGMLILEDSIWTSSPINNISGVGALGIFNDKLYVSAFGELPNIPYCAYGLFDLNDTTWEYSTTYYGNGLSGGTRCFEIFQDNFYVAGQTSMHDSLIGEIWHIAYLDLDTIINSVNNIGTEISQEVKIYPNPASESVTAEWNGIANDIELKDLLGRIVLIQSVTPAERSKELNIHNLDSGFYLLTVKTVTGSKTVKVVKE